MKILVELRQSGTHGMGVFAKEDIPADTLLCKYDGDLMDNTSIEEGLKSGTINPQRQHYRMSHPQLKDTSIVGFIDPKSPEGIGQFINDGCRPNIFHGEMGSTENCNMKYFEEKMLEYQNNSMKLRNATFFGLDFLIYSIRDIVKGEEIFLIYGAMYWATQFVCARKEAKLLPAFIAELFIKDIGTTWQTWSEDTCEQFLDECCFSKDGPFFRSIGKAGESAQTRLAAALKAVGYLDYTKETMEDHYNKLSYSGKNEKAKVEKEIANKLYRESKFDKAAIKYQMVTDIAMSAKKQELREMVNNISIAKENETLLTSGRLNQALCYIKIGKWKNAIDNCSLLLDDNKMITKAWYRRGEAKMGLRDFEGAVSDFKATLKIEPENKAAKNKIIMCQREVREKKERQQKLFSKMF